MKEEELATPSPKRSRRKSTTVISSTAESSSSAQESSDIIDLTADCNINNTEDVPPFPSSVMEVVAPTVDEDDQLAGKLTFVAQVSVLAEEDVANADNSRGVDICTFPGLRLLKFNTPLNYESRRVAPTGVRFDTFTMRFPDSFKNRQQRDRVYRYNFDLGAICGSAIIAVCQMEKDTAKQQGRFPDLSKASSLDQVLALIKKAAVRLPFNFALASLLYDSVSSVTNQSEKGVIEIVNINLDMLLQLGVPAQQYISNVLLPSFRPVAANDNDSVKLAIIAHDTATQYDKLLSTINNTTEQPVIRIPLPVPRSIQALFEEDRIASNSLLRDLR